jgi:hypothetical protein
MEKTFILTLRDSISLCTREIQFTSETQEVGLQTLRERGLIGRQERVMDSRVVEGRLAGDLLLGEFPKSTPYYGRSVLAGIYNLWKAWRPETANQRE